MASRGLAGPEARTVSDSRLLARSRPAERRSFRSWPGPRTNPDPIAITTAIAIAIAIPNTPTMRSSRWC